MSCNYAHIKQNYIKLNIFGKLFENTKKHNYIPKDTRTC